MSKKITKNVTKIFVDHGVIEAISNDFGIDRDAISEALSAKRTTRHGNVLRKVAVLFYGGVESPKPKRTKAKSA